MFLKLSSVGAIFVGSQAWEWATFIKGWDYARFGKLKAGRM